MKTTQRQRQQGAVSLFVVIFSALLLSVVTVSFIRVMNQEQRQATDNDLSQSAYDSALAGVEDAKRVVLACGEGGAAGAAACNAIQQAKCSTVADAGIAAEVTRGTNTETPIETSTAGGAELNQAYTCVKIDRTSRDYLVDLQEGQTVMIPLKAVGSVASIDINWFKEERDNVSPANAQTALNALGAQGGELPTKANWPTNSPALLETQVIHPNDSFTINDLDNDDVTQTVYLYPTNVGLTRINLAGVDRDSPSAPRLVRCNPGAYAGGGYLCQVKLDLAKTLSANSQVAFLRITSQYRPSSLQIVLKDAGDAPVEFDGVQLTVDSTGRANDVFRRIESRLNVGVSDFPYPDGAVDISGSLCKDFYVSADTAGGATCQP